MCKDKTDFVISAWSRISWGRNDPPPSLLIGVVFFLRGCDVLVLLDSSTHKKIWRLTEHRKILVPKAPDLGPKMKVLGSNFFLDGSTHLISLDDFPGKKSGERSRKMKKFPHKKHWNLKISSFRKKKLFFYLIHFRLFSKFSKIFDFFKRKNKFFI